MCVTVPFLSKLFATVALTTAWDIDETAMYSSEQSQNKEILVKN
jgi:hypothetical protein